MARPSVLIEAAIDSLAAALAAETAGADRLEVCGDLDQGGITPGVDLLAQTLARCRIPVFVMIRPRPGGFLYSGAEIDTMRSSILDVRRTPAAGIVTGALRKDRSVDSTAMAVLLDAAGPLPVTFHRAFDEVPDPLAGMGTLAGLGVRRVLTSGGAATAETGIPMIARLARQAAGRIEVVAGGSVSAENVVSIVRTGVREIHARCEADGRRIREIVGALGRASGASAGQ